MRIAVDAVGGDFGCAPNLEGAARAVQELPCHVVLVGPEPEIKDGLQRLGVQPDDARFRIVHTSEVVRMDEDPTEALRAKPRASILVAAQLVAAGEADALISAGHTGATRGVAQLQFRRLPGILRPAIAAPFPTAKGTSVLLDVGATLNCKPWHLLHFAVLGSIYAETVLGIARPTVGILSNGEEESKGTDLVQATIPLLKHSGLNYHGPVEGRDIPAGTTDVVVCDGFTGNICVKLAEGLGKAIFEMMKGEIDRSPNLLHKIGAALARPAFRRVKDRMSYDEYGGAPLLGVGATTIICHGKSNPKAIFNAIRVAKQMVEAGVEEKVKKQLAAMSANIEMARALG